MSKFKTLLNLARLGTRVVADSRQVQKGDIFVALPGTKVHGDNFIRQATNRGASYIVSENRELVKTLGARGCFHPNPRLALGELAKNFYFPEGQHIKLVGITGTNGKTTVCFLLEQLLKKAGFKVGLIGTIYIKWMEQKIDATMTTPDCLTLYHLLAQMQKKGVEVVVMEVSSHALDQDRIADLQFEVGIFTNLTQDHLDYHKNMEHYFLAKQKLFTHYSKSAIINGDCAWGKQLISSLRNKPIITYGFENKNQLQIIQYKLTLKGFRANILVDGEELEICSNLPGRYNLLNLLASIGGGKSLGLTKADFKLLEQCAPPPGRMELVPNKQGLSIIIDYAHTPDALANVCQALAELKQGKLVVVFGCGGNRDKQKRPLMAREVAKYADLAIVTTDNPRFEEPESIIADILPGFPPGFNYNVVVDRKKAILQALQLIKKGDVLLIAGKGHENYQEIQGKKIFFSDKKIVEEALC
ncbi:MAG: UDP-N-acetylmuramoyl-L-alanyl-D-glutamate--2,6-diaminopimelate ligase [Desulfonauticus sp.]|nr:UDP-N-acetylmuramoyl-L-alanyl-D-glutamate--2,6-diaminopimelate ligase [Desulfonauticus sp.]